MSQTTPSSKPSFLQRGFTLCERFSLAPHRLYRGYATLFSLAFAVLFLFACNITTTLGAPMIAVKRHVCILFFLFALVVLSRKITAAHLKSFLAAAQTHATNLIAFILFGLLVGGRHLVSHGNSYAHMAENFWQFDPLAALAKRPGLPGIAHMLGIGTQGYIYFWFGLLFVCFSLANHFLKEKKLGGIERFSILTSSLVAYLFIAPGYSEVFVLLCGFLAVTIRTSFLEKMILAALMFGTHEVATCTIFLPLILMSAKDERTEWTTLFVTFLGIYVLSYAYNWQFHLGAALALGVKPAPSSVNTAWSLFIQRPDMAVLAIFIAYKLYWIPVLANFFGTDRTQKLLTLSVLVTIPYILIACDASRLVQFSSLSLFFVLAHQLPTWSKAKRKALAILNLLIPSFYLGLNCPPLWGANSLYSLYIKLGASLGFHWGFLFK